MRTSALILFLIFISTSLCSATDIIPVPHNQDNGSVNGILPEYRITSLTLPDQVRWIEPGMSIQPTVTITNEGSDDPGSETMVLLAHLGSYQLLPKRNTIPPLKGGESEEVTLEYLIPEGIPSRDYPFFISFANTKVQNETEMDVQQIKASTLVSLKFKPPKVKSGCGCS